MFSLSGVAVNLGMTSLAIAGGEDMVLLRSRWRVDLADLTVSSAAAQLVSGRMYRRGELGRIGSRNSSP